MIIKLTTKEGRALAVNIDKVLAFREQYAYSSFNRDDHTEVVFIGSVTITVKESVNEIVSIIESSKKRN